MKTKVFYQHDFFNKNASGKISVRVFALAHGRKSYHVYDEDSARYKKTNLADLVERLGISDLVAGVITNDNGYELLSGLVALGFDVPRYDLHTMTWNKLGDDISAMFFLKGANTNYMPGLTATHGQTWDNKVMKKYVETNARQAMAQLGGPSGIFIIYS